MPSSTISVRTTKTEKSVEESIEVSRPRTVSMAIALAVDAFKDRHPNQSVVDCERDIRGDEVLVHIESEQKDDE